MAAAASNVSILAASRIAASEQDAEKLCCPWFGKLTMRINSLKNLGLILSLSKNETKISYFFSGLLMSLCLRIAVRAYREGCKINDDDLSGRLKNRDLKIVVVHVRAKREPDDFAFPDDRLKFFLNLPEGLEVALAQCVCARLLGARGIDPAKGCNHGQGCA